MTDFDPTPDDDLVSAYLDGEATAAERAVVEADPRLRARAEVLASVARAVGQPVPPPDPGRREDLIVRALGAAGPIAPSLTVTSLDDARRRRRKLGLAIVSAAAAVVVGLLALPPLLRDLGDRDGDQTAADMSTDDSDSGGGDEVSDGEAAESPSGPEGDDVEQADDATTDAPTTPPTTVVGAGATGGEQPVAPPAPADSLGSFTTRFEAQVSISDAIDDALAQDAALRNSGEALYFALLDATCDDALRASDDELVGLVYAATYDIAGVPFQVLVYDLVQTGAQNGTHRVYEVALPACTEVSAETL